MMETLEETELCFPQLLNTSCKKHTRPQSESMPIYILMSSISVLTVFLNLLVIISISHFRQLHTPTNLLLLSLAVSDFLVGLIIPFHILLTEPCWLLGDLICVLISYFEYTIVYASVVHMVLISADRYVAICYPLHYPTNITQKRVEICVLLCWFFCVFCSFLILFDNFTQPGRYNSCYGECVTTISGLADLILCFILPVSAIINLYMRVFVVAVSQARTMRSHIAAVKLQSSVTVTVKKSELKAARTLGVVVAVFLTCYCPYYCVLLSASDLMISSANGIVFLVYFNSCLNPVIYAFFYPWFRKSVKLTVTLQILQPHSCEANVL